MKYSQALAQVQYANDDDQAFGDQELVADVVAAVRVIHSETGVESFYVINSEGISPIVQVGLWVVAGKVINSGVEEADD